MSRHSTAFRRTSDPRRRGQDHEKETPPGSRYRRWNPALSEDDLRLRVALQEPCTCTTGRPCKVDCVPCQGQCRGPRWHARAAVARERSIVSGQQPDGTPPPGEDRRVKRDLDTDALEGVVIEHIDPAIEETTRTGLAVVPHGAAPEDLAPVIIDKALGRDKGT